MSVRRTSLHLAGATAFAALLAAHGGLHAQQAPAQPNLSVEGDWVRTDPEGSGSFDGLGAQFPKADLLPEVAARMGGAGGRGGGGRGAAPAGAPGAPGAPGAAGAPGGAPGAAAAPARGRVGFGAPNAANVPYVVNPMPCGGGRGGGYTVGAGLITPDSGGVHMVEGKNEVVYAGERGGWRHIWMDGRKHPDNLIPSGAGHSVGHYEGNVLVVDTVGFTPGGVPGGGQRTAETHLTERFEVQPDGKSMKVTYTWDDPKIYAKPFTYRLIYDRAPAVGGASYALEEWCDASNPIEGQSIVPPTQIQ